MPWDRPQCRYHRYLLKAAWADSEFESAFRDVSNLPSAHRPFSNIQCQGADDLSVKPVQKKIDGAPMCLQHWGGLSLPYDV